MKKLIAIVLAILQITAINANESRIIDVLSLNEISKDVSTTPIFSMTESGDTLKVTMSFKYITLSKDENGKEKITIDGFTEFNNSNEPINIFKTMRYPAKDNSSPVLMQVSVKHTDIPINPIMGTDINSPDKNSIETSELQPINIDKNSIFTNQVVSQLEMQYYRGHGFTPVTISPIQYNVTDGVARIYYEITYLIVYKNQLSKSAAKSPDNMVKMHISQDDTFFTDFVENINDGDKITDKQREPIGGDILPSPPTKPGYLILTSSVHAKAAARLALWKKLMGYDVKVIGKSEIWTTELIKSHIDTYKNQNPNFYYLVLIGDHKQMPGILRHFSYPDQNKDFDYYSDFEYACLDSDKDTEDEIPDVYCGRIPATTLEESLNAIEKIISYDKNPVMYDSFYQSAFHASGFTIRKDSKLQGDEEETIHIHSSEIASRAMEEKCHMTIKRIYAASQNHSPQYWSQTYFNDTVEIPEYLQRPNFKWDGCAQNVVDEINKGAVYGLYIGHGSYNGWYSELNFFNSDIKNLKNKGKYPVIFSFACKTGGYDQGIYCFSNELLFAKDKGAVSVIAASQTSYTPHNEVMLGALLRAIYPITKLQIYRNTDCHISASAKSKCLGAALNYAAMVLDASSYQLNPKNKNTAFLVKKEYHCFGDPSLKIRQTTPRYFNGISITKDNNGFIILCENNYYQENAVVTVIDTTFNANTIIAYERLQNMRIKTNNPNGCKICISAEGLKPYYVEGVDVKYFEPILANRREIKSVPYPLEYTGKYIDFSDGYIYDTSEESPKWQSGYDVRRVSNDEISVTCNYALIAEWDRQPDTEYWHIPDCVLERLNTAWPAIPFINYEVEINKKDELNTYYIESCDYIDFQNINCMAGWTAIDPGSLNSYNESTTYPLTRTICVGEITPYSGFYPEDNDILHVREISDKVYLRIAPLQYDMENHIMRANRRIKIRRGAKESGIVNIDDNQTQIIYFSLDGRVEPNPQRGNIYICKSGEKYSKVIF